MVRRYRHGRGGEVHCFDVGVYTVGLKQLCFDRLEIEQRTGIVRDSFIQQNPNNERIPSWAGISYLEQQKKNSVGYEVEDSGSTIE